MNPSPTGASPEESKISIHKPASTILVVLWGRQQRLLAVPPASHFTACPIRFIHPSVHETLGTITYSPAGQRAHPFNGNQGFTTQDASGIARMLASTRAVEDVSGPAGRHIPIYVPIRCQPTSPVTERGYPPPSQETRSSNIQTRGEHLCTYPRLYSDPNTWGATKPARGRQV